MKRKKHKTSLSKETPRNHGSIMALDPSFTACGWVIIAPEGDIMAAGSIKTTPSNKRLKIRKGDDFVRRINELDSKLNAIRKLYSVKLILSEMPHGSQSAQAAKALAGITAIVQTMANHSVTSIEWFTESECKFNVAGRRSVGKKDMIKVIDKLYKKVPWTGTGWIDEAIADSLAVYHTAELHSSALKMIQSNFTALYPKYQHDYKSNN